MQRPILLACAAVLAVASRLPASTLYEDDTLFTVQKTSNIVYGTGQVSDGNNNVSSTNLQLDIYRPVQTTVPVPANTPAIILVHGGGFVNGDKGDMSDLAIEYASLGYVVASINYRMYFDYPPNSSPGPADNFVNPPPPYQSFPDLLLGGNAINAAAHDAELAMSWMHDNAATYGVNPDRIGIGGVSAGGITAEIVGYNNINPHITPTVVLDFLGSMYGTENVIQPGAPAAFMFHGNADTVVPFSGDQAVADQLTSVGVYHEFYVGQGIGHELDDTVFSGIYGNETLLQHNIDFLATHLVPEPGSIVMAALGLVALAAIGRRRAREHIANWPGR